MALKLHWDHQRNMLLYCSYTGMLNSTLDIHDIIKSSPHDNTKLWQFTGHIMFVILDPVYQHTWSEGQALSTSGTLKVTIDEYS